MIIGVVLVRECGRELPKLTAAAVRTSSRNIDIIIYRYLHFPKRPQGWDCCRDEKLMIDYQYNEFWLSTSICAEVLGNGD